VSKGKGHVIEGGNQSNGGAAWQTQKPCQSSRSGQPQRNQSRFRPKGWGADLRSTREKRKRAAPVQIASVAFETYFPLRLIFIDWQSHLSCTELPFLGTT